VVVAPEIVCLEEQEYPAARLVPNGSDLSRVVARAKSSVVPLDPGGATTTQRLSCSGWYVSSTSVNCSLLQKNARASS
jgi:hypothetical protein